MSNNIKIQETGVAKNLDDISEIQTPQKGGGTITWVPEAERKVMKKTVTAKGKYKAKDDHVYAYDVVVVNISGSSDAEKERKEPFTTIAPDITIQEGGVGKAMYNVKKLEVSKRGSDGTCFWIPEDNVKTGTLSVSGNGTFKAVEHGVFGWTEVSVSKKAKRIYHDDTDGNDYAEYEDGTVEKIPSSIKVTTPPDKLSYIELEPINTAGMVVTAYYGDGTEYGVVEDWTYEPLVAIAGGEPRKSAKSDLVDGDIAFGAPPLEEGIRGQTSLSVYAGGTAACIVRYSNVGTAYARVICSASPFTAETYGLWISEDYQIKHNYRTHNASSYTYANKTVYYYSEWSGEPSGANVPINDNVITTGAKAAWTVIYGDITIEGGSKVDVHWEREEDGKILSDSFEIEVRPPL